MTLLDMGKDPANFTDDDFDAAIARLQKAVDKGQIRRFTGNDYTSDLTKGDLAACVAWAGDVVQLKADSPDVDFVIPDSGYMTSTDNLLIPNKARHKTNAERLIDYYYEPKPAAELAAYINYVCPGRRSEALAREDRQGGGEQPADHSRQGHGREVPRLPLAEPEGRDGLRREVREAHRGVTT